MKPILPLSASLSPLSRHGLAVLASSAAIVLQRGAEPVFLNASFLLLYPAVFFISWIGGRGPGLVATAMCALGADNSSGDARSLIPALVFLMMGISFSVLNGRGIDLRRREREARTEAEAQRQRLHDFFMQAPIQIAIVNGPDFVYELSNPANTAALGGIDVLGKPLQQALPDYPDEGLAILRRVYETGHAFEGKEFPVRVPFGPEAPEAEERFFDFIFQPIVARRGPRAGRVESILCVAADVTDTVHARQSAQRNEARLNFALKAGRLHLWEWDVATDTVWRSEKHDTVFGLADNLPEFHTTDYMRYVHPEDRDRVGLAIEDALNGVREYDIEYRVVWPDGSERWVHTTGQLERDADGRPLRMAGGTFDVTDRKRVEHELQAALRVRDEFLSIASHELRTPLTSLKMQLQLSQRYLQGSPERMSRALEVSKRQSDRLTQLVDDLLDVSRIQAGKVRYDFQQVDVLEMVREFLDRTEDYCRMNGSELTARLPSGRLLVSCDRNRFEQVLANLVSNAIKYGSGKPVEVSVWRELDECRISVRDQGMGIEPTKQGLIFDRFERAVSDSNISGLGLGLFISREIVKAHRGRIDVESEPGRGSRFTVRLPLAGEA